MDTHARVVIPTKSLSEEMEFFSDLGFKLRNILPDDNPDFVRQLTFFPAELGEIDGLRLEIEEVEYVID